MYKLAIQLNFEHNIETLSKILSIIRRLEKIARKKNRWEKWQNRLILTSDNVLDEVESSDLEEISDQCTDSDDVEWEEAFVCCYLKM